jgi:tRNA-dihydrouridine synthase B
MTGGSSVDPLYPPDAVILAPLSGYTDLAFRRECRRQGCEYAFTPLIEAGSVVYGNPRTAAALRRGPEEPWLGLQILGSQPARLAAAVRRIAGDTYDVVDLNMGCPVAKVTRRNAGAALPFKADLARDCLQAVLDSTDRPVTAKMRILDEQNAAPTIRFAEMLATAGIRALTIHGRTWERFYSGPVAAGIIRAVAEELDIPVVANGGVMDGERAAWLRQESHCSRIMVARGAIGNPWIFREIADSGAPPPVPDEICDAIERHVRGMVTLYSEGRGMRCARKIIQAYLRRGRYPRELRHAAGHLASLDEFRVFMDTVHAAGPAG